MLRHTLRVAWSEEDASFVVDVPERPGCAADGATYAEAVANAAVVTGEWIETAREFGRPVPESKRRLGFG